MAEDKFKKDLLELRSMLKDAQKSGDTEGADSIQKTIDELNAQYKQEVKAKLKANIQFGATGGASPVVVQRFEEQKEEVKKQSEEPEKLKKLREDLAFAESVGDTELADELKRLIGVEAGAYNLARQASPSEVAARGFQAGLTGVARGVGLSDKKDSQMSAAYQAELERQNPLTYGASKIAAETGALIPTAIPAAALAPEAGAAGIAATALRYGLPALEGATQANILARGQGEDAGGQIAQTGAGGVIGAGLAGLTKVAPGVGRAIAERLGIAESAVTTPNGTLTPEFEQYLVSQNKSPQDFVEEVAGTVGTIREMKSLVPKTEQEAAAITPEASAELAQIIQPNLEELRRFREIGLQPDQIPMAAYSQNPAVQDMSATLNRMAAGGENIRVAETAKAIDQKAADVIRQAGGDLDAGTFSQNTMNAMRDLRENMYSAENAERELVNQEMANFTRENMATRGVNYRVAAPRLVRELEDKKALRPNIPLSKAEQDVLNLFKKRPTFQDVEALRQEIGAATGALPRGSYADQQAGTLKHLYGNLTELTDNFSSGILGEGRLREVKNMTIKRKALEDQIEFFGGRDGLGSMVANLKATGGRLKSSDYAQFDRVFANIPEENHRGAAATLLNQIINADPLSEVSTSRPLAFYNTFKTIDQSVPLKTRMVKALGQEHYNAFANLSQLYKSLSRATQAPATGLTAGKYQELMKQQEGLVKRLFKSKVAQALPTTQAVGTAITDEFISAPVPFVDAVNKMIKTPAFNEAMVDIARGSSDDLLRERAKRKAESFMKTKAAKNYLDQLYKIKGADAVAEVMRAGSIPAYLMATDEKEN